MHFKTFIFDIFSAQSDTSSKRFTGFIILINNLIMYWVCVICAINIPVVMIPLYNTLTYVGGALLGLGIADKLFKFNKIKKESSHEAI